MLRSRKHPYLPIPIPIPVKLRTFLWVFWVTELPTARKFPFLVWGTGGGGSRDQSVKQRIVRVIVQHCLAVFHGSNVWNQSLNYGNPLHYICAINLYLNFMTCATLLKTRETIFKNLKKRILSFKNLFSLNGKVYALYEGFYCVHLPLTSIHFRW